MVMPQALIEQRPDVVKAWLQAELDAATVFADSKNAMEIAKMALSQTTGFQEKVAMGIRVRLYAEGRRGTDVRIDLAFGFTPEALDLINKASAFTRRNQEHSV